MSPSDFRFKANPDERLVAPDGGRTPGWAAKYLAPAGVLCVYAALLALAFYESRWIPVAPPAEKEIPIEIVAEQPPDPPAPSPQPQPTMPPSDETVAYDAPRAPNKEKIDTEADGKTAKAAPAPTPSPTAAAVAAPKPVPSPEPSASPTASPTPQPTTASVAPITTASAKDETPPVAPTPQDKAAPPPVDKESKATPAKPTASVGDQLPTFASVPDIDFGGSAALDQMFAGKAKSTYLSILYGKIMGRLQANSMPRLKASRRQGTVEFSVDGRGRLMDRRIAKESDDRDLDRAVFDAIGAASPFPPPPHGMPMGMAFNYE